MFRDKNQYLDWQPSDGMRVEVRALVTLYQPRGDFQLNVETIRRAGLGSLFEAFEQLKARLGKEGLFDPDRKKPLPLFPKQIGIITSPAAAALHDVLSTLRRRMSFVPLIIYGTPVQGAGASAKIAAAIRTAGNRAECDVLILCRGGGSIEDLWAFNEEAVARAIAACPIPIVSGVGHETDFTIADFVADVRAPTPTGASQLVCPDRKELIRHGEIMLGRLQRAMQRDIESRMQHIDMLECRLVHPGKRINDQRAQLQRLRERLARSWRQDLARRYWRLRELDQRILVASPDIPRLAERQRDLGLRLCRAIAVRIETLVMSLQRQQENLAHLNPESVLERGYSIVYSAGGAVVRSSDQIDVGDTIQVVFAKGGSKARVTEKNE
jgi:exodeoxyribonuclease VII large subunit